MKCAAEFVVAATKREKFLGRMLSLEAINLLHINYNKLIPFSSNNKERHLCRDSPTKPASLNPCGLFTIQDHHHLFDSPDRCKHAFGAITFVHILESQSCNYLLPIVLELTSHFPL